MCAGILYFAIALMIKIVESADTIEQKHLFWALWEQYFTFPVCIICMIYCLWLMPYWVKLVYGVVTRKNEY